MAVPTTPRRRLRYAALALAGVTVTAGTLSACGTAKTQDPRPATTTTGTTPGATSSTAAAVEPSLHMITNEGHKLAFYVTPGRLPAIVLDAGGGLDASYWNKLAPELAKNTGSEVITYDRTGEGKSDDAPGPWKAQNAAADLAAGLTQLGITKNVVLVSHSLAGEIATAFVQQHPDRIAGAVLVDANLPQFFTDSETAKLVAANTPQLDALRQAPQTRATRQLLAEAADYGPVHLAYHKLVWPRSVPATAIVSSQTPFPTPDDAQLWRQAQQDFVDAAPNRHLVVAENSSHDIPTDRPDVVINAVQDMVNQVR
ncbi:pimeloyl-ACP methyl ester carboxylesterase [Kitasatospora sp. MAA19]|uniref:alpha/beta fold hydrolase n=1 Tax=Kitasatospora sp. MAA19 TaxID=3035090 RepID=UPI0024737FE2|nr:alpha/beta hydrolase [Kitasatospora sp. MAA19]MDH6705286.1 pimeloyl-ACP methyl ester carboxylesterase [Kitasatospora sp. MAA19]